MIEVRVSIGLSDRAENLECIRMQLGGMPRIGESILMTPELEKIATKRRQEWGLPPDTHVNIVKRIGYDREPTPILMLSTHPSTLVITCIDELGKEFSLPFSVVPRVGEQVISPKDEVFFVKNVIYGQRIILLELSSKEVVAETRIIPDNNPMPVEVANPHPVEVYCSQLDRGIDVNVTNSTLYVQGERDY